MRRANDQNLSVAGEVGGRRGDQRLATAHLPDHAGPGMEPEREGGGADRVGLPPEWTAEEPPHVEAAGLPGLRVVKRWIGADDGGRDRIFVAVYELTEIHVNPPLSCGSPSPIVSKVPVARSRVTTDVRSTSRSTSMSLSSVSIGISSFWVRPFTRMRCSSRTRSTLSRKPAAIRRARWPRRSGMSGRTGRSSLGQSCSASCGCIQTPRRWASSAAWVASKKSDPNRISPVGREGTGAARSQVCPAGAEVAIAPGFESRLAGGVVCCLDPANGEQRDLVEGGEVRIGEAIGSKRAVVAGQIAGRDRESPLRDQEDEHPTRAKRPGHARQEGVLQPVLLVVVRIWGIEEQHRERSVGQPDGEGARGEDVVELDPGLFSAVGVDLDPEALRAQSRRDRGGGLAGPAQGSSRRTTRFPLFSGGARWRAMAAATLGGVGQNPARAVASRPGNLSRSYAAAASAASSSGRGRLRRRTASPKSLVSASELG